MDYFHATDPTRLESIYSVGLKLPWTDEGDYPVEGTLGHGVYISRSWQTALWFGRALLRVQLTRGTNILDVSEEPEVGVIRSLRREFGNKILSGDVVFHEIIPPNKRLTLRELTMLTKYHFHRTWASGRPSNYHRYHGASLRQCWSMLRRYRFDGFGHLTSDIGVMILSPERIRVVELVAVVRERPYARGEREFGSIDELREYFRKNGERKHRTLAARFAALERAPLPSDPASEPPPESDNST